MAYRFIPSTAAALIVTLGSVFAGAAPAEQSDHRPAWAQHGVDQASARDKADKRDKTRDADKQARRDKTDDKKAKRDKAHKADKRDREANGSKEAKRDKAHKADKRDKTDNRAKADGRKAAIVERGQARALDNRLRATERIHARRGARLRRIEALAGERQRGDVVARVEKLMRLEDARHARALARIDAMRAR